LAARRQAASPSPLTLVPPAVSPRRWPGPPDLPGRPRYRFRRVWPATRGACPTGSPLRSSRPGTVRDYEPVVHRLRSLARSLGLGPTHPERTNLPQEPFGLRRSGFAPDSALLMPAFALPRAPGVLPVSLPRPGDAPLPRPWPRRTAPPWPESTARCLRSCPHPRTRPHGPLPQDRPQLRWQACQAPLHFRRRRTRPVSYYALFQGWLLLSQPPGCLSAPTSFSTEPALGDLPAPQVTPGSHCWRSGLFPSRRRSLAPDVSRRTAAVTGRAAARSQGARCALLPTAAHPARQPPPAPPRARALWFGWGR
jgi:hypothetical protein